MDSSVIVLEGGPVIVYSYASLLSAAKLKLSTSSSVVVSAPLSVSKRLSVVQVTYEYGSGCRGRSRNICWEKIIVEIKAVAELADNHGPGPQRPQGHRAPPGPPC